MAIILDILRAILRALGLLKPASSEPGTHAEEPNAHSTQVETPHYPYRRREDFLSPAERNFFRILYQVVGENALICVKVNLADLFYVPSRDPAEHRVYTNKIDRKHVDFVLCDPQTLTPKVGIELDDRSHNRTDRQQRDHFVANVFAEAGLPLLRVKVQRSYAIQELAEILHSYLGVAAPVNESDGMVSSPTCPQCGSKMVLRSARSGANAGQKFWGCTNYPRCHGVVVYTAVAQVTSKP